MHKLEKVGEKPSNMESKKCHMCQMFSAEKGDTKCISCKRLVKQWKEIGSAPFVKEELTLVVGCNYHTTWQSDKRMRFVLSELKGNRARLTTRTGGKSFWTDTKDLIFITTNHNKLIEDGEKTIKTGI